MVISIVAAHLWGVFQLILLGSLARTVRIRTVYAAMAVGLYLCAPLTVALQVGLTKLIASASGMSFQEWVDIAAYSFDPFIEELLKMLPLMLLALVPLFRRQWSLTDFILIGASSGTGFGMAEDIFRFGGSADHAQSIVGGWVLVFFQGTLLVPGIGRVLTSWLPQGVGLSSDLARLDIHLIWSTVAGFAVGLAMLVRTKPALLTALGLYVLISLDHAAHNAVDIGETWLAYVGWPLRALGHLRALMPLAALGAAWWLDRDRQHLRDDVHPLLKTERDAERRVYGTMAAALMRLPGSLLAVDGFVRMRRAVRTEHTHTREGTQAASLMALLVKERDRIDRELGPRHVAAPAPVPAGARLNALRGALRRPVIVVWLVIMTPSALWFIVGGWPQTAGLQTFMTQPLVAKVLFPISVLAQAWISWRTLAGLRAWPQARGASIGDEAAVVALRMACGIGAVALGGFSLLRMLGGLSPGASVLSSLHAQSAANRLSPTGGSMLAGSAGSLAPPPSPAQSEQPTDASQADTDGSEDRPPPPAETNPPSEASQSDTDGSEQAPPPKSQPAPRPARVPDPAAAAKANADAAAGAATAATAQADAATQEVQDARQRKLDAQNAQDSAEIKAATGADRDPAVIAAQERARAAHTAADAADIAASNDFNDPWTGKSAAQSAADHAQAESRAADAAAKDAQQAAQEKLDADAQDAKAAEKQAEADETAAQVKAAAAKADAAAKVGAAQTAQQQVVDPNGVSVDQASNIADQASRVAADAQHHADSVFSAEHNVDGEYRAANEAAIKARQQADAARAAADAAKSARETYEAQNAASGRKPFHP